MADIKILYILDKLNNLDKLNKLNNLDKLDKLNNSCTYSTDYPKWKRVILAP